MMAFSTLVLSLIALSLSGSPGLTHGKGLYATEAEAQQRAEQLGCSSTHQNNNRWMPCANEQELHQQLRKQ